MPVLSVITDFLLGVSQSLGANIIWHKLVPPISAEAIFLKELKKLDQKIEEIRKRAVNLTPIFVLGECKNAQCGLRTNTISDTLSSENIQKHKSPNVWRLDYAKYDRINDLEYRTDARLDFMRIQVSENWLNSIAKDVRIRFAFEVIGIILLIIGGIYALSIPVIWIPWTVIAICLGFLFDDHLKKVKLLKKLFLWVVKVEASSGVIEFFKDGYPSGKVSLRNRQEIDREIKADYSRGLIVLKKNDQIVGKDKDLIITSLVGKTKDEKDKDLLKIQDYIYNYALK